MPKVEDISPSDPALATGNDRTLQGKPNLKDLPDTKLPDGTEPPAKVNADEKAEGDYVVLHDAISGGFYKGDSYSPQDGHDVKHLLKVGAIAKKGSKEADGALTA